MDTKASSSSELKPPMADELLNYYTKDQLRMHFMSLGLVNKHWVNNVKIADATDDAEFRKQLVIDCFYACKVMAILIHPIAPEGCEMFREYLNLGEELWDWNNIFEPVSFYTLDVESH